MDTTQDVTVGFTLWSSLLDLASLDAESSLYVLLSLGGPAWYLRLYMVTGESPRKVNIARCIGKARWNQRRAVPQESQFQISMTRRRLLFLSIDGLTLSLQDVDVGRG